MVHLTDNFTLATSHHPTPPPTPRKAGRWDLPELAMGWWISNYKFNSEPFPFCIFCHNSNVHIMKQPFQAKWERLCKEASGWKPKRSWIPGRRAAGTGIADTVTPFLHAKWLARLVLLWANKWWPEKRPLKILWNQNPSGCSKYQFPKITFQTKCSSEPNVIQSVWAPLAFQWTDHSATWPFCTSTTQEWTKWGR